MLTIGAQFFNFFNHPNFGDPDNWMADQTFGQIIYQEQSPTSILGSGLGANVSQRILCLQSRRKAAILLPRSTVIPTPNRALTATVGPDLWPNKL